MGKRLEINTGDKFGEWTIVEEVEGYRYSPRKILRRFKSQCSCGNIKETILQDLTSGKSKTCGCSWGENHELRNHYLYSTWCGMKTRCYNKNRKDYPIYGGRGIKVCDSWKDSFSNFLKDMGDRPDGYSIDRIDNNKGYSPENCKWSTSTEQRVNQRRKKCC